MRTVFCLLLTFSIYSAASAQAPPQDEPRIGSLLLLDAIDGVQLPRHGVPKVIGGIPARTGDDPWQVALLAPNHAQFCGGSLIAPGWVLTAAHCVDRGTRPDQVNVLAGTTNLLSGGLTSRVLGISVHEHWMPATHDFDIALLRIADGHGGAPVSVMTDANEARLLTDGVELRTTGWGSTSEGGAEQSLLRFVSVPFQPPAVCNRPQSYGGSVTTNMLCAGVEMGGKDTCQGDSGGPLTIQTPQGRMLVGAVSWGDGCGRPYKFGVYTRLSRFTGWIRSKMTAAP